MNHVKAVREFIINNFLFGDFSALQDDKSFLETGIVDSTGMLELVTYLESAYGFRIEPEEMIPENLDSVNRVAAFIDRKQSHSAASSQAH